MRWVNHLSAPQFTTADICKAGNIEPATLKARRQRRAEHHGIPQDRVGGGRGSQNLYAWPTLMHEVLTEHLVKFGLNLTHANDAAAGHALLSDGAALDFGEREDLTKVRQPGQLYDDALTYLIVDAGNRLGRVVKLNVDQSFTYELLTEMAHKPIVCLVDVSRYDRMARGALGVPDTFFMMKDNRNG